jgi:hypothetical protein
VQVGTSVGGPAIYCRTLSRRTGFDLKRHASVAKECVGGDRIRHAMGIPQNRNPDHSVFIGEHAVYQLTTRRY